MFTIVSNDAINTYIYCSTFVGMPNRIEVIAFAILVIRSELQSVKGFAVEIKWRSRDTKQNVENYKELPKIELCPLTDDSAIPSCDEFRQNNLWYPTMESREELS